jgi:aspartate kinase
MKILKFGGTSVGSPTRMKAVYELIKSNEPEIIVLSAVAGTTNTLVEISQGLHAKDTNKANAVIDVLEEKYAVFVDELYKTDDYKQKGKQLVKSHFDFIRTFTIDLFTVNEEKAVLAQGELISTALFHYMLEEDGYPSVLMSALDFMRIDENSEPDMAYIEKNLHAEVAKHPNNKLFITQGFICRNTFGEIDNLKRGGSDYTASLVGAAINANEIQIWTDIDGMHNNDPRIVGKTYPIAELSFDEAAELAYFGAKILHPSSVLPAQLKNIPVRLLNTMQPEAKGTVIKAITDGHSIKAVAAKDGITTIKIKSTRMLLAYGFLRRVFEVFERYRTSIDMITTSEVAVAVTIDNDQYLEPILVELNEFCSVEIESNQSIICIVGDFVGEKTGYAARVFDALKDVPIHMISYGASEHNITLLVDSGNKKAALLALNQGIFGLVPELA